MYILITLLSLAQADFVDVGRDKRAGIWNCKDMLTDVKNADYLIIAMHTQEKYDLLYWVALYQISLSNCAFNETQYYYNCTPDIYNLTSEANNAFENWIFRQQSTYTEIFKIYLQG